MFTFTGGIYLNSNKVDVKEFIDQCEVLLKGNEHVFFYIHDLEHYWEYISSSIFSILGYSPEELIGTKFDLLLNGNSTDNQALKMTELALLSGKQMPAYKIELRHKIGNYVELEIKETPIKKKGKVIGIQGFAIDITEKRRIEDILIKNEKLSLIGQLAAGVAHEIRNPLTSIKGFIHLLKAEVLAETDNYKKYFSIIESELDRINFIVSEFLFLSKPLTLKMEKTDICKLLDNTILLFETETNMKSIKVSRQYKSDIPAIICEPKQLMQVFINLLKNSVDALEEGGNIYVFVKQVNDEKIRIRFQDEGCGIPKSSIKKLGEPFYTTKEDGTGLGLMISNKIIKEHQGSITIKSEEDIGTTIDIFLPSIRVEK